MRWFRVLAGLLGAINEGSLLRFEYVLAENKILRKQIPGAVKSGDSDRRKLAELGKQLGRKVLAEIGSIVTPDTTLGWYWKLIAKKFNACTAHPTHRRNALEIP